MQPVSGLGDVSRATSTPAPRHRILDGDALTLDKCLVQATRLHNQNRKLSQDTELAVEFNQNRPSARAARVLAS